MWQGRGYVVGMRIRLQDRHSGVQIPSGKWDFVFSETSRPTVLPSQPHTHWIPQFLGAKRQEPDADQSLSHTAEIKKVWSNSSISPIRLPVEAAIILPLPWPSEQQSGRFSFLLSFGCREFYYRLLSCRWGGGKLNTPLCLMLELKTSDVCLQSPIFLCELQPNYHTDKFTPLYI